MSAWLNPVVDWSEVDLASPLADHPLNEGRIAWWLTLPQRFGGPVWWDLTAGRVMTLGGGASWTSQAGVGQVGSLATNGVSGFASAPLNLSGYTSLTLAFSLYTPSWNNNDNLAMEFTTNYNSNNGSFIVDPNSGAPTTGLFQVGTKNNPTVGTNFGSFPRPTAGTEHRYLICFNQLANPTTTAVYVDGVPQPFTQRSGSSGTLPFANSTLYLASRAGSSLFLNGRLNDISLWGGRLLSASSAQRDYQLSQLGYPDVLRRHSPVVYGLPGATNFALDAQPAVFQLNGEPASLLHDFKIDAAPTAFDLNGATAAFLRDRVLSANPTTFQLDEVNAGLLVHRFIDALPASFVLNGVVADFLVGFLLNASAGAFQLTGFSATLKATRLLSAANGTFHLTGSAAGLIVGYQMNAVPAALVLTGQTAALRVARVLDALAGSFTLDGANAALLHGYSPLAASPGSHVLSGRASGLRVWRLLTATPGSFSWTGNPAFFVYKPLVSVTIPLTISSSRLVSFLVSSTLKQTFLLDRTVAVQTNLTCPSGQARIWTATFQTPTAIAGQNFAFTARDAVGDILFQLTTATGGITITDPVNGVLTIAATAANTTLPPQQGEWDLWRTDAGFEDQLGYGSFTVTPNFRVWSP